MRFLRSSGISCILKPTGKSGDARRLGAEAVNAGCSTVVVAGGDGTLNEVLSGLADVPGGLSRVRLGVLPIGTVNVFAKEHRLPSKLAPAWAAILQGHERNIDLVRVEYQKDNTRQKGVFAQMGGAGLDARAIEKVTWELKRRWGPLAYVWTAWRILREPQSEIQTVFQEGKVSGQLVLIGNGRYYGGRFPVFSKADAHDGRVDCLVFTKINWTTVLQSLWALARGRTPGESCATYVQTRTLTLSSREPVAFEVDGEFVGYLPVTITVDPGALRLLAPCA